MTLSTYRTSPYWKAAIDLGPALARLADDLPGSEEFGLSAALRKLSIALPAAIAVDLMAGQGSTTRYIHVLKLSASLELIDRIYPALDTASTRSAVDALAEQLFSESFGASEDATPAAATPAETALTEPAAPVVPSLPVAPAAPAAPVAPVLPAAPIVSVPVAPADPAEPQLASPLGQTPAPAVTVPVAQENHVQPDSQE